MIRLEMKSHNMIILKKQQKYLHYHQIKLINMNIILVKKIFPFLQKQLIDQARFIYFPPNKYLKNKQNSLGIKKKIS